MLRQEEHDHQQRCETNGEINPEHDRPAIVLYDKGTKRWSDDGCKTEYARQHPLHPGPLDRRVNVANDGIGDRLHAPCTDALDSAERNELEH